MSQPDPKFRVTVTYRPGNENVHPDLKPEQALDAAYAFTHDMVSVGGVTKLVIEAQ